MTPEDAIARGLHVGYGRTPLGGPGYRRPRAVRPDGSVVIRDSDCEPAQTERIWSRTEWDAAVAAGGLWRRVGIWDFVLADDPAADEIAFCYRSREAAGRKLLALSQRVAALERVLDDLLHLCEMASFANGVTAPDGTNEGEVLAARALEAALKELRP
jgi:hypothetical protein